MQIATFAKMLTEKQDLIVGGILLCSPTVLMFIVRMHFDDFDEAEPYYCCCVLLFLYLYIGNWSYSTYYQYYRQKPPSALFSAWYTLAFVPFFLSRYLRGAWRGRA